MGRRYLRESENKIDEVELERYIWSVAEDCAKNIKEQLLEADFEVDSDGLESCFVDVYLPSVVRKLPNKLESFLYEDLGLSVLCFTIVLNEEDKSRRTGNALIWFQEYDELNDFIDYTQTSEVAESIRYYINDIIWNSDNLLDIVELQESRSKRVCSNKRNFIKEGKKRIRPSKKDIEEAIRHIAYAMASDLANADFSKDGKDLYKHVTIYANDEVDNDYILEWLENNGFEFFEGSIDGMVGEKFYNISCFGDVISSTQDGWDDVDTLEDVFYRAIESELEYSYIFDDLLDDAYYAESKSSSKRLCKKVARSLKESKRKSFRGGATLRRL